MEILYDHLRSQFMGYPSRIICLTEESVETLYLLGRSDLIVGVSKFVERPPEAKRHPVVSQFIRSDIDAILAQRPDLILGFSDLQKDIARELIGRGQNVLVTNQRSVMDILNYVGLLGRMIGEESKVRELVAEFQDKVYLIRAEGKKLKKKPRVYFEEWDHPRLSAIKWVSELIEICGGENIFGDKSGAMAQEREVSDAEVIERNPDIILGCWCGKKVSTESITQRPGYQNLAAVKNNQVFEVNPAIFLQPGPALFVDGLDQLLNIFKKWDLDS
jgi:iron complex transport system substrate-binding protein